MRRVGGGDVPEVFLEEDRIVVIGFLDLNSKIMQHLCHYAAAQLNYEDTVVSIAVTGIIARQPI